MYTVYILYSQKRDKYYIGYTNNISDRLKRHNSGQTSTTRGVSDWVIVYQEEYEIKTEAIKREREIKNWKSRKMIEKIIAAG